MTDFSPVIDTMGGQSYATAGEDTVKTDGQAYPEWCNVACTGNCDACVLSDAAGQEGGEDG